MSLGFGIGTVNADLAFSTSVFRRHVVGMKWCRRHDVGRISKKSSLIPAIVLVSKQHNNHFKNYATTNIKRIVQESIKRIG